MISAKLLGVLGLLSVYVVVTTSLSSRCEESNEVAYPRGSHGAWDVLCQYRLCRANASEPAHMMPSSFYEAELTNDDPCVKTGGFCQAAWSYLSVLQYNATERQVGGHEWGWNTIRVTVSYACKTKISRIAKRRTRLTRISNLEPLIQRNATCWEEKLQQLLSTGEVDCPNSEEGYERCCTSRKSYRQ